MELSDGLKRTADSKAEVRWHSAYNIIGALARCASLGAQASKWLPPACTLASPAISPQAPTDAVLPPPSPAPAALHPTDPRNKTERFRLVLQQPAAFMTPELRDQLRQRVLVIVRGYLSSLYRACLGAYLDHQAAAAQALGMRVLVGNICCCSTSARNSASLAAQIAAHTAPHDRVIILAHSHGTLAALDLLCNPAHAAVSQRVECFLPLNGVFGGTPMADLCTSSSLVSAVLEATWGRLLAVVGGGEAGVLRDMTAAARRAYHAQHGDRIAAVLRRVAVVALASHYRWPRWPPPRLLRVAAVEAAVGVALLPQRMVMDAMGWAPNDGCVPLASQLLPGAAYVVCEGLHHVHTVDDLGALDLRAFTHTLLVLASEARLALMKEQDEEEQGQAEREREGEEQGEEKEAEGGGGGGGAAAVHRHEEEVARRLLAPGGAGGGD